MSNAALAYWKREHARSLRGLADLLEDRGRDVDRIRERADALEQEADTYDPNP